jgi:hypothetical protein
LRPGFRPGAGITTDERLGVFGVRPLDQAPHALGSSLGSSLGASLGASLAVAPDALDVSRGFAEDATVVREDGRSPVELRQDD